MLRPLFSSIPFLVCLFWLLAFLIHFRRSNAAQRMLTLFVSVCTLLYFCHFHFFTFGPHPVYESLWTLCSLSVYPLYFVYICTITSCRLSKLALAVLFLPAGLITLVRYLCPEGEIDLVRQLFFSLQVVAVCILGLRKLLSYDRQLACVYADTDERNTFSIRVLLVAFIITSVLSAIANAIGRQYFAQNEWSVFWVQLPFSLMLYALCYIGFNRQCQDEDLASESEDEVLPSASIDSTADADHTSDSSAMSDEAVLLGSRIEALMLERQYYLTKNLKITDVAREVASCRTYVSNYINQTYHCSFSDYINRLRVEHAQRLLSQMPDAKLMLIADSSGFANEQSFYRNFHKVMGVTPSEWIKSQKQ